MRHGEVDNPRHVVYGRLPGFGLSERGHRMAAAAADELVSLRRPVRRIVASPLKRAQESAAPIASAFDLGIDTEPRVIEPTNRFEGRVMSEALRDPRSWPVLVNPWRPSWGERYRLIAERMLAAMDHAMASVETGDVVVVSHQLPIWIAHLACAGQRYIHDPRQRRCALSSITTFERPTGASGPRSFVEVGYLDPAAPLVDEASDVGAT